MTKDDDKSKYTMTIICEALYKIYNVAKRCSLIVLTFLYLVLNLSRAGDYFHLVDCLHQIFYTLESRGN